MEYIIIIIISIIWLIILALVYQIKVSDIKKIKEIGFSEELNKITDKLPENEIVCKQILKQLNSDNNVKIVSNDNAKASLYIVATNTISIAKIKDSFTRIQTIAHECIHSVQNKKIMIFNFIYSNFYFDYYGISYELFNNNELGFLYNFGFSILILLCFGSLMYCYMQLFNKKEMNVKLRTIVFNILLIIVSNIIVVFSLNYKYSLCQLIFNFLALIAIEIIMSVIFFKIDKREKNKKYDLIDLSNTIKIVPFYIVLLLFSLILSYGSNIVMNKSYRIIGNDKVIVYTTNDYYLTLDCKIKNNELTIYKGKQSKINNEDVVSELINFDKVELK